MLFGLCPTEPQGSGVFGIANSRRAIEIAASGWGAGIANPEGGKPKGMHWRTFRRLRTEYRANANASWAGIAERLGLVNRRLTGLWGDLNGGG